MPKDKEHPYGHGKYETVGALGVSSLLFITGGGIAWHAVDVLLALAPSLDALVSGSEGGVAEAQALVAHAHDMHFPSFPGSSSSHSHDGHHHGIDPEHMGIALAAAVVSIGVKEGLYQVTKTVGDRVGSKLLEANAWHHRSDAVSSLVALVGVGGAMFGQPWLDPLAGLVVSGMIIKASYSIGRQSLQELLDVGVAESMLAPVRETVLTVKGVEGVHHLRGRRMGPFIMYDLHIEVDPWLSVSAAHNIGEAVRRTLRAKNSSIGEVLVHIDPADGRKPMLTPAELESLGERGGDQDTPHDVNASQYMCEQRDDDLTTAHRLGEHNHADHTRHRINGADLASRIREATGRSQEEEEEKAASTSPHSETCELSHGNRKRWWEMKDPTVRIDDHGHDARTKSTSNQGENGADGPWFGLQANVEKKLKRIINERFPEIQGISHVTCHFLKEGVSVHVEVMMDPDLRIREAMEIARRVERAIETEADGISKADIHLELNHSTHR